MTPPMETIYAGVDTHTDTHTLALLDWRGRPLATRTFPTDAAGYEALAGMLPDPSRVVVGVEGTNSYGAALARRLAAAGYETREVLRPKRAVRRRDGKSDPVDAAEAARSVMAGDGTGPKSSDGWVEALRHLNTQRDRLVSAMTTLSNSVNGMLVTAPETVRDRYRSLR
ncbi:transposase, partial [Bifidobacterium lemurum]